MVSTSVPPLKPSGAGDRLADRNRAGQHRAIKGGADFRLGQVLIGDGQRPLGAFERVLGQVVGGLGVVVDLLGDELVGQQLLRPLVVAFGLFQVQLRLLDVGEIRRALLLEFLVVQLEQQVAFLEAVAQVHRQQVHLAVDFGAHGHLLGGGDLAGGIDGEVDVAQLGGGGGRALRDGAAAWLAFCQFFQP